MSGTFVIEPVISLDYLEAMRFVAGGGRRDIETAARAESLMELARSRSPRAVQIWWARRQRRPVAAAMSVANAGRCGTVVYSPLGGPAVDAEALGRVIHVTSAETVRGGLAFVQIMLDPSAAQDIRMVTAAGLEFLAELIYMRRDLGAGDDAIGADEGLWRWLSHGQFDDASLGEVITATYKNSLDCPRLSGIRRMEDVLASHRSGGVFRPANWWLAMRDDRPGGCILANDYPLTGNTDVVYLGVTPEFRGQGLAATMLRRACRFARWRGLSALTLAVDAANAPAIRIYQSQGLRAVQRRVTYAMFEPVPP
ncbi:MAG: GNAT family N-acetyltransferase [Phycisphaerae bacterium]